MPDKSFFNQSTPLTLQDIATLCKGELRLAAHATKNDIINDLATIEDAKLGEVCLLHNAKYHQFLNDCQASLLLLNEENANKAPSHFSLLICKDPHSSWASLSVAYYPFEKEKPGVHPSAVIHETAKIASTAYIGAHVTIGENVTIGEYSEIHSGTHIDRSVQIGSQCKIHHNCTISHTIMGDLNVIQSGARVGQDGFGFAMSPQGHQYVRQLGRVIIGNDVNIGSNTAIDRGSCSDTIIEDGVRIDNLVQLAHNVQVGRGSVIVAQVGISGSTSLGQGVVLAGQTGVAGHIHIADGAIALAQSSIAKNIPAGEVVASAIPAISAKQHWRRIFSLNNLIKNKKQKKEKEI